MKQKPDEALVQVLEPTTDDAYHRAQGAINSLPLPTLPAQIRRPHEQDVAVNLLRQVAAAKKSVEAERKKVTKHLDAAKKAVMSLFKPMIERLDGMREHLEGKLNEYSDWQVEEAEKEREKIRKEEEAKQRRAARAAEKKLALADSREERREIKQKLDARLAVQQATMDSRLGEVDDRPDAEEGVAVIQDIEIISVKLEEMPESVNGYALWERVLLTGNLKKALKAGLEVDGVNWRWVTRRAVRPL